MSIMLYAIPVFFLLIGVELIVQRLQNMQLYYLDDALTNISCGTIQQITGAFIKTFMFLGYLWLYDHVRLTTVSDTWWTYTLLFIGVDFCYYWFHRLAHEISLFWGTHIVHHQSEEYNLSVALRQSSIQKFVSTFFYLPLAVIGFNPVSFLIIETWQTLYQFWIHTRAIKKMPAAFEYIFNTPAHHRVHHGVNPKYIDKNHGGTLIIFDRMFGTFQEEEEEVVYGVTKSTASWNPLWVNFTYYKDLWKELSLATTVSDKLGMLFRKPGWRPSYLGGPFVIPEISANQQVKYRTVFSHLTSYYVLIHYALTFPLTILFMMRIGGGIGEGEVLLVNSILATFVIWSLVNFGALMERKPWAKWSEIARLIGSSLLLWALAHNLILVLFSVFVTLLSLNFVLHKKMSF